MKYINGMWLRRFQCSYALLQKFGLKYGDVDVFLKRSHEFQMLRVSHLMPIQGRPPLVQTSHNTPN